MTTFPDHAYSKWEVIDKRADDIIAMCESNVQDMLNSRPKDENNPEGKPYNDVYHYALSGKGGSYYSRCADVLVNWMLAIPMGRTITEAMAADTNSAPNEIMDTLKEKLTTHLKKENAKFTESKVLGNWTGFSTKLYENLLKSYKKDAKDRERDPLGINRQSRTSSRVSYSSRSSNSSKSSNSSRTSSMDADNKAPVI